MSSHPTPPASSHPSDAHDLEAARSSRPSSPLEVARISHIASPTMSSLGPKAATPDVLPPSPPLTDLELRAAAEDAQAHLDAEQDEMDITNAGSSWEGPDQDDSESSKGVPSADHAIQAAFADAHGSASQHVQEHPLRMDVHPPSPTPWEVTGPPPGEVGAQRDFYSTAKSRTVHEFTSNGKPSRTRPLVPHSAYYFGPPPADSAYGTDPIGQIGVHHPREIVRIERDYTGGELVQFAPSYPLELEGRVTPTQFLETINAINELLISAHSLRHSFFDNALSFFTLQVSRLVKTPHYESEMQRLHTLIDEMNTQLYNPVGLNILWPRKVAFLFLEIEYY